MEIHSLADAPAYDDAKLVAVPFAEGTQSNARLIRLSPGQTLPPHTHGVSDLLLYAVEGEAVIETDAGPVPFPGGTLAVLSGDEELRVTNPGATGATFLAFLAPAFPPRA
jgi:redox-sensitive bicupin YhaK (pirin superfamily)